MSHMFAIATEFENGHLGAIGTAWLGAIGTIGTSWLGSIGTFWGQLGHFGDNWDTATLEPIDMYFYG